MNFDHEELMLMMLYNPGTRLGLIQELRLMQCYLAPDEVALRELSERVIEKLKLLTDAEFGEVEFPLDYIFELQTGRYIIMVQACNILIEHATKPSIVWHCVFDALNLFPFSDLSYCQTFQALMKQCLLSQTLLVLS